MKKITRSTLKNINMPPLLLAGIVLAFLIVCFIIFYPENKPSEQTQDFQEQMSPMETRLAVLEEQDRLRIKQINELSEAVREFTETSERMKAIPVEIENLQKKIDNLDQRQGNMEKKIAARGSGRTVKAHTVKTVSKPAPKSTPVKYHNVGDGETLYSIARLYGITVEHLSRLNNLSPDSIIQPNQKLIVDK